MMPTTLGISSYEGAGRNRLMADQPTWDIHPLDAWNADGQVLLARSGNLARNNAYAKALINAMQSGVVGPHGLLFKSQYESDPDLAVTDDDRRNRRIITRLIARAIRHIDADGLLNFRQWEDSLVYGKAVHGEAIKVRVAKARPNATHLTAWRTIHPARVCNPDYQADSDRIRQGISLDDSGSPTGLWIANQHPNLLDQKPMRWTFVPLLDASGIEQVIWHSARTEPEQLRAPGWYAPLMGLLVHLGKVTEAHTVAKRLQACLGMIVEVDDPLAAARKDRNGVVFTGNTRIEPGKTYYVKKGSNVKPFDFKYEGADYEAFTTALLQALCAAFGPGIPWQFALQQLTKSNMAAARAALMQAWRSFRREQVDHEHELRIVNKNYLAEDLARGRLTLPTGDDLDAACAGYFVPPQRLSTDDSRELEAAAKKRDVLGISRSTLAREYGGYDMDDERAQSAEDAAADERAGISPPAPVQAPVEPQNQTPEPDDDDEIETDDETGDDEVDGTDEGEPTGDDEDQMP
jgi:capsid protein